MENEGRCIAKLLLQLNSILSCIQFLYSKKKNTVCKYADFIVLRQR